MESTNKPGTFAGDSRLLSYLALMAREHASDLFLFAGAPPTLKRQGDFTPIMQTPLGAEDIRAMAYSVMRKAQIDEFEATMECDLSFQMGEVGRFRINVHQQRGNVGMVVRHVTAQIPSLGELGLPDVFKQLAFLQAGLVLTVGAAGSGKTTSLAAMLNYRNESATGHILTVEDPIEYLHRHKKSLITQREIGLDTRSYDDALRHAMREAPNVIMIGEIRDRSTMQHALHYAESGHLCVSTMHASNARQAVQRILNFFPEEAHKQLLMDLSLNLRAIVAQRLVKSVPGPLVPATEVMLWSPYVAELIQKGQIDELRVAIERSGEPGMCTFDHSLYELQQRGVITAEEALAHADNRTDMSLRLRLAAGAPPVGEGLQISPQDRGGRPSLG
ncbi:PilT/PilU family type 4a pilus ATPase [Extensimonas vulgaris]|uniref:Twitching motility protein PilU n=1 Tax=Extensimonas vulgaris TaxID=1031594 RepID=A0A369AP69_9BURK|nr:PilT/PilU family type 4a pilus ATPase [Extensimonas vulgaris]RCX09234.1 twitching motility protein PilU [Extensimonas vulgaris]TWI37817.1 twitching motility protein PilU [Extensimonas vulgaris]TXD15874.1 PilT/PilU family type 4a pilus ATPase [Extensimonas vulgaris]